MRSAVLGAEHVAVAAVVAKVGVHAQDPSEESSPRTSAHASAQKLRILETPLSGGPRCSCKNKPKGQGGRFE